MNENSQYNLDRRKKTKLRQKKDLNNRLNILLLVSFVFLFALVVQFILQRKKIYDLNQRSKILISDTNNLKDEVERLQKELEKVNTLEYIEKVAREKLGMIKNGEKIYIPSDDLNNKETVTDNDSENNNSRGNSQSEGNDARQ